jgi:hypothetical protein
MSFQRESFVCCVGNIECHGTIEQHMYERPGSGEVPYYKVGVIVAGIRSYAFDLMPFDFNVPSRYTVSELTRRSVVRDLAMENLPMTGALSDPQFPDVAFEAAVNACVQHYMDKPPLYPQATAHLGEL